MRTFADDDLAGFRAAVRLRERCADAAVVRHERAGLRPDRRYAYATFDAVEQLIRDDERRRVDGQAQAEARRSSTEPAEKGSAVAREVPEALRPSEGVGGDR